MILKTETRGCQETGPCKGIVLLTGGEELKPGSSVYI